MRYFPFYHLPLSELHSRESRKKEGLDGNWGDGGTDSEQRQRNTTTNARPTRPVRVVVNERIFDVSLEFAEDDVEDYIGEAEKEESFHIHSTFFSPFFLFFFHFTTSSHGPSFCSV